MCSSDLDTLAGDHRDLHSFPTRRSSDHTGDQVRRGQSLAVDQLTGGEQLRTLLVQALTHSLQADQKFVAWAQNTTTNGCTGHAAHDSEYAAAQTASSGATTSKQSFVQLWNPIATRYGLSTRSESSF